MKEAEIIFGVIFPTDHQAAIVVEPGEEAFDFPALAVAAQAAAVLSSSVLSTPLAVRSDHLSAVFGEHLLIEAVTVVGFVADQPLGRISHKAMIHRFGRQLYFSRGSTRCANGD